MRLLPALTGLLLATVLAGCGNVSNSGTTTGGYAQGPAFDGALDSESFTFYLFHPGGAVPAGGTYLFEIRGAWKDPAGAGGQVAADHVSIHFSTANGQALQECLGRPIYLPGDNFVSCTLPAVPGAYRVEAHLSALWHGAIVQWTCPASDLVVH